MNSLVRRGVAPPARRGGGQEAEWKTRCVRRIPLHLYLLSLLSAGLQVLPFPLAGPVPEWRRAICWICLTPLLIALIGRQRDRPSLEIWQSTWLGYLCGVAWYL